jgi:hypothetical protein
VSRSKLVLAGVIILLPLTTPRLIVAQPPCLHAVGESVAERARRGSAIQLVRRINTAEVNVAKRSIGSYQPLAQLGVELTMAPGFEPHFTTDGESYALILRDSTDSCGYSVSTNQQGIIFQGYPIDYDVQPVAR